MLFPQKALKRACEFKDETDTEVWAVILWIQEIKKWNSLIVK